MVSRLQIWGVFHDIEGGTVFRPFLEEHIGCCFFPGLFSMNQWINVRCTLFAEDEKGGKQWRTVFSFQNNKNKQTIIKCLRRGICHLYTKATHFNSYTIHNSRAWHSYGNLIISMSAASILKYFLNKEPLKVETTTRIKVVLDLKVWETDDDRWYHVDWWWWW